MLAYQVPQREIQVVVYMNSAKPLKGHLFVPADEPSGVPRRLSDRLVEPGERFLPVAAESGAHLIARDLVLRIELLSRDDSALELDPSGGDPRPVACRLVDGTVLEGTLSFWMPPGRERLLDYVNSVDGFVALRVGETVTLVNQRHVVTWTGD